MSAERLAGWVVEVITANVCHDRWPPDHPLIRQGTAAVRAVWPDWTPNETLRGSSIPRKPPADEEPFDVLGVLKALFQSGSLTRRAEPWLHDAVRAAGDGQWGYVGPNGETITPFGTLLPMEARDA